MNKNILALVVVVEVVAEVVRKAAPKVAVAHELHQRPATGRRVRNELHATYNQTLVDNQIDHYLNFTALQKGNDHASDQKGNNHEIDHYQLLKAFLQICDFLDNNMNSMIAGDKAVLHEAARSGEKPPGGLP